MVVVCACGSGAAASAAAVGGRSRDADHAINGNDGGDWSSKPNVP